MRFENFRGAWQLLLAAAVIWRPDALVRAVTHDTEGAYLTESNVFSAVAKFNRIEAILEAAKVYLGSSRLPKARMSTPTAQDVLRYRYHHGANLGSVFVLERWLAPNMFDRAANADDGHHGSELYGVQQSILNFGLEETRRRFEEHWNNAITQDDWRWLVNEAHCTTIRVPVGYFTLGPKFTAGTPFDGVSQVYINSWVFVQRLVAAAYANGIGVLLDFHALPGGANNGEHSGTDSGKPELWGNQQNLQLATRCIEFMAQQSARMPGVIGIQLVNEADGKAPQNGMYEWYNAVIAAVSSIDPDIPLYISDAWDLSSTVAYAKSRNKPSALSVRTNPIVIDTHKYYCFGDADKRKSPGQIISGISNELNEVSDGNVFNNGAVSVVVFEYSTVLAESSWAQANPSSRQDLARRFGNAESTRWQKVSGAAFWAFVTGVDGRENGWSFKGQVTSGAIFPPNSLLLDPGATKSKLLNAQNGKQARKGSAYNAHVAYWDRVTPGKQYEHYRFPIGWEQGFNDASAFFSIRNQGGLGGSPVGGDKIGMLDLWVLKRMRESGESGALAQFGWEWEQGFRQGVQAFYDLAGI